MPAKSKKNEKKEQFLKAYEEYADAIFKFCYYKVSNRERAKDIVQDTFTKTWEYINKGYDVGNIKAFLYKTANNLIIDWFRKKKSVSLDALYEEGFDPGYDRSDSMMDHIDGERAIDMLNDVDEIYRTVIMMRYVDELSIKEIAAILKEKENNISVRLHRGLEKLRQIFNQYEQ